MIRTFCSYGTDENCMRESVCLHFGNNKYICGSCHYSRYPVSHSVLEIDSKIEQYRGHATTRRFKHAEQRQSV